MARRITGNGQFRAYNEFDASLIPAFVGGENFLCVASEVADGSIELCQRNLHGSRNSNMPDPTVVISCDPATSRATQESFRQRAAFRPDDGASGNVVPLKPTLAGFQTETDVGSLGEHGIHVVRLHVVDFQDYAI